MIASIIVSVLLALGVGTTAAANTAKPGDFLFGWDQATEHVRLALTFGEEAKARYEAQVAEERVQEQLQLEAHHSEHAQEAAQLANQALDQAIQSVTRVRAKLDDHPGNAAAAMSQVETRLRALQTTHENRLQIESEFHNGQTEVKVEIGQNRWEWQTTTTDENQLISEISARTGLSVSDIRAALPTGGQDTTEDRSTNGNINRAVNTSTDDHGQGSGSDQSDDNGNDDSATRATNQNTNQNRNQNTNREMEHQTNANANTNSHEDGEDATKAVSTIRVRVDLKDGETEIRTVQNGQQQEWQLQTTTQATIIASIMARTGLSSAEITSMWDFEQK